MMAKRVGYKILIYKLVGGKKSTFELMKTPKLKTK